MSAALVELGHFSWLSPDLNRISHFCRTKIIYKNKKDKKRLGEERDGDGRGERAGRRMNRGKEGGQWTSIVPPL